jgi:DNA-binding MarR family transcriptional regulator
LSKPSNDAAALAIELHDLVGRFKRRLREESSTADLPPSHMAVLRRLEREGPHTVTALARAGGMRSQSMGATVASLQAAGHVSGAPDPEDGRQTLLSITPSSRKWLRETRATRQDWLARAIQAELSPREQQELARGLALLQRIVEAQPPAAEES